MFILIRVNYAILGWSIKTKRQVQLTCIVVNNWVHHENDSLLVDGL